MNIKYSFMESTKVQLCRIKVTVFLLTTFVLSNSVLAVDIAQEPLFLQRSSTPNIMFILDDSGSMDWDILTVPHWRAQNYDHDYSRTWARGGWLAGEGASKTPTDKVVDGSWVSYSGHCEDRNADGVCYNKLDLNGLGGITQNDGESPGTLAVAPEPDWKLGLRHFYYTAYEKGRCEDKGISGDASDYLPNFDDVLAFLTGSRDIFANEWARTTDIPSIAAGSTDRSYAKEEYKERTEYEVLTWENELDDDGKRKKDICEAQGNKVWVRDESAKRIIHGADQHPILDPVTGGKTPRWGSEDWVSASRLDADLIPGIHGNDISDYVGGNVGGYHEEFVFDDGIKEKIAIPTLDIDGDGYFNANFFEHDHIEKRAINYYYLHYAQDNVYRPNQGSATAETNACQGGGFQASADACPSLYYPNGYDPTAVAGPTIGGLYGNLSGKVASSRELRGKNDIVTLPGTEPSHHRVERFIRSGTWVYLPDGVTPRTVGSNVGGVNFPSWTKTRGAKHAMSLHDPWPLVVDWRARSASFNVIYYNPSSDYRPWPTMGNANFNAVRSNPYEKTEGVFDPENDGYDVITNLARKYDRERNELSEHGLEGAGFVYEVWQDDAGTLPSQSRPEWKQGDSKCSSTGGYTLTSADIAASASGTGIVDPGTGDILVAGDHSCFTYLDKGDGVVDLWDTHYRVEIRDESILVQEVRRSPHLKGEPIYMDRAYATGSLNYWDEDDGRPREEVAGSYRFDENQLASWRVAMSDTRVLNRWDTNAIYDAANVTLCKKILGVDKDNSANCRPLSQIKQNAANWYQYSRKRSFAAKGAIAALVDGLPNLNYGLMGSSRSHVVDNNDAKETDLSTDISQLFSDVYDGKGSGNGEAVQSAHNVKLQKALYAHQWRQSGTPLRQTLQRAGEYFAGRGPAAAFSSDLVDHSNSPIIESCQKSFAIMLTDGYWNGKLPESINNKDGDGYSNTLADVAKKYYDEDLRPSLDNDVPVDTFDTNNKQHLSTIGVGFGVVTGSLSDTNGNGWPGSVDANGALPYTESSTWGGDPTSNNQYKVDDLWHAAYNSRGLYLNAEDPSELIKRLQQAVLFASKLPGSASAVSVNSNALSTKTRVFQTTFQSDVWSGDVKSFPLNPLTGELLPAEWSAQQKLRSTDPDDRQIFTINAAGDTVPFLFDSLDADQIDSLRIKWPSTTAVAESADSTEFAKAQINYIRGEDSNGFRARKTNKLGDIVHSEAVFIATPKSPYFSLEGDYEQFRTTHLNRKRVVYVGANDGMLHAFDASTGADKGEELFAYIPGMLIPRLNSLTQKDSSIDELDHRYFVDATPTVADAYFGDWKTVLVGGLGGGGKGVYALDITNAATNKKPIALWEFTESDNANMGYSFSKPTVVKLNDSNENGASATRWGAIFGNGYDSKTGKAVLYVINIKTGAIIKAIDTGVGNTASPNGLSSPTVIDSDGDLIADRVYAGDLLGNVWSFDISSTDLSLWSATKLFTASAPQSIAATAAQPGGGIISGIVGAITPQSNTLQPITQKITVQEHPLGTLAGYLLHFGTGQFFRTTDNDARNQATQSIYAIWDCLSCGSLTPTNLLEQEVELEVSNSQASTDIRVTSNNTLTWLDDPEVQVGDSGWRDHINHYGWYLNLKNPGDAAVTPPIQAGNYGERIVSPARLYGRSVIFSTLIPSNNACEGGGSGWLMSLNSETGARFEQSSLDVNGDGIFDADDHAAWIDANGNSQSTVGSGIKSRKGIPTDPVLVNFSNGNGDAIAVSDHSTSGIGIPGVSGGENLGRQSWIQLE